MQGLWGRKISDYGYAQFFTLLQHKANEYNKKVAQIDKWYPSSKACSSCGHILDKLELKTRSWQCPECNTMHDRDINAANNILRVGLSLEVKEPALWAQTNNLKRVGASTLAGETVRPMQVG